MRNYDNNRMPRPADDGRAMKDLGALHNLFRAIVHTPSGTRPYPGAFAIGLLPLIQGRADIENGQELLPTLVSYALIQSN